MSTDRKALEALIEKAKRHTMTPEEFEAQRRSWVRGEIGLGNDADEAAYRAADETTRRRLDAEAEERIRRLGPSEGA